jgi:hypothetical protein
MIFCVSSSLTQLCYLNKSTEDPGDGGGGDDDDDDDDDDDVLLLQINAFLQFFF